jgi:hypothetical protein
VERSAARRRLKSYRKIIRDLHFGWISRSKRLRSAIQPSRAALRRTRKPPWRFDLSRLYLRALRQNFRDVPHAGEWLSTVAHDNGVEEVTSMSTRLRHLLAGVALLGFVAVTACQQRQEGENTGADTLTTTDTTMMAPPPPPPSPTDTGMGMGADTSMTRDTSMGHDTSGM